MAANGGKRKKNKKKKAKATAGTSTTQPRRSTLTPGQRLRVENMHEILGEVWEPFKTAEGAIRGLEADAAPWLELEFWDSLAEAFFRYFGKAITLQVDTAGLARAQRELAKSNAAAQSLESSNAETSTTTTATPTEADTAAVSDSQGRISGDGAGGDRDSPQGGAGRPTSSAELQAAGSEDSVIVTGQGERRGARQGQGKEEGDDEGEGDLDPGAIKLEMLPMGAVGHLGRRDQLGIIRKTVAREKRMLVLQRLFHLAQAPSEEVERLVAGVKELKNNSASTEIRDVNLLETWQGVREERAAAWEDATEQVRLAAVSASDASLTKEEEEGEEQVKGPVAEEANCSGDAAIAEGDGTSTSAIAVGEGGEPNPVATINP